jgi:hypothetical protein
MPKGSLDKSTKEMYLLLVSERLGRPLCPPMLKKGNVAQFTLTVPFVPRLGGYYGTKTPKKSDIIRIYFVTRTGDNEFSQRKKMGEYDFTTVDLEEILPSQVTAKLKNPHEKDSSESGKGEEEDADEDEEEDSDAVSSSKSSSADDPRDQDYAEMTVNERIASCSEEVIYWQPEQQLWEFKFPVIREPPHLALSHVNLAIVKKKKG